MNITDISSNAESAEIDAESAEKLINHYKIRITSKKSVFAGGQMIVYIHSDEIEDRGVTMGRHAGVRDLVHIIVPRGASVAGIVSLVEGQITRPGSIWTLIFNGHGDSGRTGEIFFGSWINSGQVSGFSPLGRLMNRGGRGVELHCCRAASSEAMMVNMARAFGVRVMAGMEDQLGRAGRHWGSVTLPFGGDTFGVIEGQTVVAFPNGRVASSAPADLR